MNRIIIERMKKVDENEIQNLLTGWLVAHGW